MPGKTKLILKSQNCPNCFAKRSRRVSNPKFREGFTLIELLITIFLISVGLIGVIAFFNSNLQSQFGAKNEIIAAGLAQEGTELVRNIVEYNFLNDVSGKWYRGLCVSGCKPDKTSNLCRAIDYTSLKDHNCENKISLCFDGARYYECPNNGNASKTDFKRDIDIGGENVNGINESPNGINLDAGDCLNVTATVGWPISDDDCANDIANCPYKTVSTDIICKPRQ
ncbi:MAG: prepilin-type N-terminal cleavage/methylation domain-containing protein [Candidatus Moranbacteria bacterium]|nr:prepilin-type N-terminal cleavage/methylation domain-containing protein [Candidatus Moranbacteria bacterium]